jgi:hypothetical protein
MRNRIILGILVVVLVLSGFAFAQEEVQLLEEAKTLLAEGKFEDRKGHFCGRRASEFWSFSEENFESLCRGRADSPLWGTEELHHPP